MSHPKFKFGDKVSLVSAEISFEIFAIGYDSSTGYYYRDEYHGSIFYKENELELVQEPQKKKLYAHEWVTTMGIEIRLFSSEVDCIKRAPEYDIEYPEPK